LLQIPKELRLLVYDALFEPLIQRPEHFDTYVLPSEWPTIRLSPYTSLLLICRQLFSEVRPYFKSRYLARLTLYFDNVSDLCRFHETLAATPDPSQYQNLQICLHTRAFTFNNITRRDDLILLIALN